jgi:preprotein translocase subunit Sec61beta
LTDEMPIACHHKGVAIFAGQSARRVVLVRKEIDRVSKIGDLEELLQVAGNCAWAPEARIYAGARCLAGLQRATERREPKPNIDPDLVVAATAGLASTRWADPFRYCSDLDMHPERAARREQPLDADEE